MQQLPRWVYGMIFTGPLALWFSAIMACERALWPAFAFGGVGFVMTGFSMFIIAHKLERISK